MLYNRMIQDYEQEGPHYGLRKKLLVAKRGTPLQLKTLVSGCFLGFSKITTTPKRTWLCAGITPHQAVVKFMNWESYSDCKRSGHPQKTTQRDDMLIQRCVVKSPTCSAKKIWAELGETGWRISRRTISPHLTDKFGLKSWKLARKPRLTPARKLKRLQFAKKKIQRLDKPAMVQSFVFRRNNHSAVCLEEENCETTRNSVQWKIHTENHETPAECDDLGSDFNPRNGRPILPWSRYHHEWQKNIWNWWKGSWSYTWQCIIAKYLRTTGRHAIRQKSSRTFSKRKISNCWNGLEIVRTSIQLRISWQNFLTELKNRVVEKHPTSLLSLIKTIKPSWVLNMPTELRWNLIKSMPRRIRVVLEAKGGHTKFWMLIFFLCEIDNNIKIWSLSMKIIDQKHLCTFITLRD